MKIELKNLKHSESLSEETHAYTATVYVDGQPLCTASNHGTGGPDDYTPVKGRTYADIEAVNAWLKANKPADTTYGITVEHDLEIEIGEQINAALVMKEFKSLLRRRICVLDETGSKPEIRSYKASIKPTPENFKRVPLKAGQVLLNTNTDAAIEQRALKALSA